MRLILRCELDTPEGQRRRFVLHVDRPYPAVPRVGEYIIPSDDRDGRSMHAREVQQVIYANDGTVMLVWSADALINDPAPQIEALTQAGYRETGAD